MNLLKQLLPRLPPDENKNPAEKLRSTIELDLDVN